MPALQKWCNEVTVFRTVNSVAILIRALGMALRTALALPSCFKSGYAVSTAASLVSKSTRLPSLTSKWARTQSICRVMTPLNIPGTRRSLTSMIHQSR
jgi:hypothetical protein